MIRILNEKLHPVKSWCHCSTENVLNSCVWASFFYRSTLDQPNLPVYLSLCTGIFGAIMGYALWQENVIATSINAGGLLSGFIVYIYTAKLQATGYCYWPVITAGGLLGQRAIVDICLASSSLLWATFGAWHSLLLQVEPSGYEVEESLMLIFIVSSIPSGEHMSWPSMHQIDEAEYYISNQKLLEQQRSQEPKNSRKVANLGLLATGDASLQV